LKNVVKYLIDNYADELPQKLILTEAQDKNSIFESSFGDEGGADEDDLYEEARDIVIKAGKASTSYLATQTPDWLRPRRPTHRYA
jgi:DNA segregation ATPase FtsK/SpoIIIE-like protein